MKAHDPWETWLLATLSLSPLLPLPSEHSLKSINPDGPQSPLPLRGPWCEAPFTCFGRDGIPSLSWAAEVGRPAGAGGRKLSF